VSTIVFDERAPRWIRELTRFAPLHSLVLLHGNVLDLASYPVETEGDTYWTESDIAGFLRRFLTGRGYDVVGVLDPVDGLALATDEMRQRYQALCGSGLPQETRSPPRNPQNPGRSVASGLEAEVDNIRRALRSREAANAFVIVHASRLVTSPNMPSRQETDLMLRLLKAAQEATEVVHEDGPLRNLLVLVCDKLNDLPAYLYVGNPRARAIHVDRPDATDRTRFLRSRYRAFHDAGGDGPDEELCGRFSALTDGLTNFELLSLVSLSRREEISARDIEVLCERFKYGVRESPWDKVDRERLDGAEALFNSRVRGQTRALTRALDLVKRARLGLAAGSRGPAQRPRGVLFFAGPTGVGKTETAKCLAQLVFGHEDRLLRFDMSEYGAEHADQKLMGAPPGYVGYEEGGQLTNQVKRNPFSVLLFDEIEKAHPSLLDKFLQILDDGRLTDGQGETVYFNETVIIFTSNLGTAAPREDPAAALARALGGGSAEDDAAMPGGVPLVGPEMSYEEMSRVILGRIRDHFNFELGRPEILNRFGDNFVVFDFIRPPVAAEIAGLLLSGLCEHLVRERALEITIGEEVREAVVALACENLAHGGRGVRNVVDAAVVNPLARWLFDHAVERDARLRLVRLVDNGDQAPNRFQLELEGA